MKMKAFRKSHGTVVVVMAVALFAMTVQAAKWVGGGDQDAQGRFIFSAANNWESLGASGDTILTLCKYSGNKFTATLNEDFTYPRLSFQSKNCVIKFDFGEHVLTLNGGACRFMPNNYTAQLLSGEIDITSNLSFGEPKDAWTEDDIFTVSGEQSILKVGTLTMYCGSRDSFTVSDGGTVEVTTLGLGTMEATLDYPIHCATNIFSVTGSKSTFCYKAADGNLALYSAAIAEGNRFELKDANVTGLTGAISIAGGVGNDVILDSVQMGDPSQAPTFAVAGTNNRLLLRNFKGSYDTRKDVVQVSGGTGGHVILTGAGTDIGISTAEAWNFFGTGVTGGLFEILDGAVAFRTNANKQVSTDAKAETCGNTVRISGEGSKLGYDGAFLVGRLGSHNALYVEDGGLLKNMATPGIGGGLLYIGQNACTNDAVWVRGGKVEVAGIRMASSSVANSCRLSVSASGYVKSSACWVGWYQTTQTETHSRSNVIEVLDGGHLELTDSLRVAGEESSLFVSNGTVTVANSLLLPETMQFDETSAKDMHLVLAGAETSITAGEIVLSRGTDMTVILPEEELEGPYLTATGDITIQNAGPLHLQGYVPQPEQRIIVLAEAGGSLTVDASSLAALNSVLPEDCRVVVRGNKLLLKCGRKGLMLLFR